jgi:hypothetical protein
MFDTFTFFLKIILYYIIMDDNEINNIKIKMKTLASNTNDFDKTRENLEQSQKLYIETEEFLKNLPDDQLQNLKIWVDFFLLKNTKYNSYNSLKNLITTIEKEKEEEVSLKGGSRSIKSKRRKSKRRKSKRRKTRRRNK